MDMMLGYMLSQYEELPLSKQTLCSWLEKWIDGHEEKCSDNTFAERFPWKEMGLPRTYFLQRKLCINSQYFLTGARYKGGDISSPFIDIVASSAAIDDDVIKAVSREWAKLKPLHIRHLSPGYHTFQGVTDQLIYASCLLNGPEYYDDAITLKTAAIADFEWCLQALAEAYQHTLSTIPALTGHLCSINNEDLLSHILQGNAYIVQEQGVRAGLIVCEKEDVAFLKGYRITEEVILPAFRGRSLASRAQRLLRNHLYHFSGEACLITGTILPENCPSIRTAEKAGRACVLRYEFLPVILD
jgi:hypothetical protein